jgi:hypothetical protein
LALSALMALMGAAACGSSSAQGNAGATTTAAASVTTATSAPPTTAGSTTISTEAGQATTVVADCGSGAYRPARIVVTCADSGVVATEIQWSQWTTGQAVGTSVVQVNPCQPTCAAQTAKPYNGQITLSNPVGTSHGPRFARLTIAWTGSAPYGQPSNSYALTTST